MIQSLAGSWLLARDPHNIGRENNWCRSAQSGARPARVPGIIHEVFPDYHGVVWYWVSFQPIRLPAVHERSLLRFGAVDYLAEVWLNGVPVGGHEGGETPFTLDATAALKPGENLLAVRVLNPTDDPIDGITLAETPRRNKFVKEFRPGSSYDYGGILLPVDLLTVPSVRISDVFVRGDIETGKVRVTITIRNEETTPSTLCLSARVRPAFDNGSLDSADSRLPAPPGESRHELTLCVPQPHLWSTDDPFLYQVIVRLDAALPDGSARHDDHAARFGFRDFRIVNGFFRLNGKRIFLRSTHTGNHVPIGWVVPHDCDFLRRDLVYAKASGFNMVRFIAGMSWPEQLDLCDELGLMVYEESLAAWLLGDSPKMAERFDRSTREMIVRDRNHPCITVWGMLNETQDGPVFRHAVAGLPLVRSLDETRLVLLGSGRWDADPGVGSASNPGSVEWEHVWGIEAPDAPKVDPTLGWDPGGYTQQAGDAHAYPKTPQAPAINRFIRDLGKGTKPVFLSEYGIGSLMNVTNESRHYEQVGARPDLADAALIRSMAEKLQVDWERFGLDAVYPFPEDMLLDSQRLHARQRLLGFDLIRSNPRICGFNLTGMLDHGITGEGLWTFWREWKPGIVDALADGWAPLRWCLFVDPPHGYAGRKVKVEAVLANEDVLRPGEYPASFRIFGPSGPVWRKDVTLRVPKPVKGKDGSLALPVLLAEVTLSEPGQYEFAASIQGCMPAGGRLKFHVSGHAPVAMPKRSVLLWGVDRRVRNWLTKHGVVCRSLDTASPRRRELVLIGDVSTVKGAASRWNTLARLIARGCVAVFLSPLAFREGEESVRWLPLANKGKCYAFHDWLYHKECIATAHSAFDGLQAPGILDWDYYGTMIPQYVFEGQDTPDSVAAVAIATGYCCPGGYMGGTLMGSYRFGAGSLVLNTFPILEHLGKHPTADRLMMNLIAHGSKSAAKPLERLPAGLNALMKKIGY